MLVLAMGLGMQRLSALLGVPERQPGRPAAAGSDEETTDGWTELPLPPEVRAGAAHVWTGTKLIARGGCAAEVQDDCEPTADGFAFDPATETWRELPEAPIT